MHQAREDESSRGSHELQRRLSEAWLTSFVRQLESGEWACVHQFLFTYGLLVGVEPSTYRTRFCYPTLISAIDALLNWNGDGDPPDLVEASSHRHSFGSLIERWAVVAE